MPEEAILGRICRGCNTFREKAEFTSYEWGMINKASCRRCKPEERKCSKRSGPHTLEERSDDSSVSEGEPEQLTKFQSSLGIKLRAVDPRYITHYNREDVVPPVSEVKELIRLKRGLSETLANVLLTTAEMGFSRRKTHQVERSPARIDTAGVRAKCCSWAKYT